MVAQLSENFTLEELTVTNTGLPNNPSYLEYDTVFDNLQQLAVNVLQKVRNRFGPTKVTSGFRNAQVNEKVGGTDNSQHRKGEAADFDVPGVDNLKVALWIADNCVFDQLILEDYVGGNTGWIHCSYRRGNNRKQTLTKPKGSSEYIPGLPSSTAAAVTETAATSGPKWLAGFVGLGAAAYYLLRKKK